MDMKEVKFKVLKKEIVLELGKQTFFIPKQEFLHLINSKEMAGEFERQLGPDDDFSDLRCVGKVALYDWLLKKGYDEKTIATVMNITQWKLRNWLAEEAGGIERIRKEKKDARRAIMARFDQGRPQRLSEIEDANANK